MTMTSSFDKINFLSNHQFIQFFKNVFEHSPWIIQIAAKSHPFDSYVAFIEQLGNIIQEAPPESRLALIKAHPKLGHDKIPLTAESVQEQEHAKLHTLSKEQKDKLEQLNARYQQKFEFPFIICVRNHCTYPAIIFSLEKRLSNTKQQEIETALNEIKAIAAYRIQNKITTLTETSITLSTHILDLVNGKPAAHVKLDLFCQDDLIFEGMTNQQGRCVIKAKNLFLTSGFYQLAFHVSDYFKAQHYPVTDPPFLNIIRIDFGIANGDHPNHYHIPLLLSPYGFSTYRGN